MARIVLGIGTSHSPQMNTGTEWWRDHAERDRNNPELWGQDGKVHTYDELLSLAPKNMEPELTPERWRERYEACQRGVAAVSAAFRDASPDVALLIGDDHHELFDDTNFPALMVYWGETIHSGVHDFPLPSLQAGAWAYGEKAADYPVESRLGEHLIKSLVDGGFDVAHSRKLVPGKSIGHAYGFVFKRVMDGVVVPVVPLFINTYYPPNQPTPRRCYELGEAVAQAVASWKIDSRVAVVASGGLSHFVIDEDLDREALAAMGSRDVSAIAALPVTKLNSGTSEIRAWIAAAGAAAGLKMRVIDYVPCYRSLAGTGCAMGFATWS